MYQMLKGKVEGLKDETLAFATELVRTPSPSLKEGAIAAVVEKKMRRAGYDRVFRDSVGNVVGVMFGRESGQTVLLNSHLDAVAVGDETEWGTPPFSGSISQGRLRGRGASDCKGGLAAQVMAGFLLKRGLLPLSGNLVVAATVAEENGLSLGVRTLMEKTMPALGLKPVLAVLGEPTGLDLYYGHDGWMQMNLLVEGKTEVKASEAAEEILRELEAGAMANGCEELAMVRAGGVVDADGRRRTIQVTQRMRSQDDAAAVIGRIERQASMLTRGMGDISVTGAVRGMKQELYTGKSVDASMVSNAWTTDPFHPLPVRARQALTAGGLRANGGRWQLGRLGMGTAGGVLSGEFGVPVIGYGPGTEEEAHAVNESVETARIIDAVYGSALIAHGLVGIPVCGWTLDEI
jgi:acetylornithine deacetylase/succinyl-diaminopimelate desuccinylase-like protein